MKRIKLETKFIERTKTSVRRDFYTIDELPQIGELYKGKKVIKINNIGLLGYTNKYDCYELLLLDELDGYKRFVIMGKNLEPLPCYSFDTKKEAETQIDKFIFEEDTGDEYWISDYAEVEYVAIEHIYEVNDEN